LSKKVFEGAMQQQAKKSYKKPALSALGSVEAVTGWIGGGAGEFFGGGHSGRGCKVPSKGKGPADFGS
jgi:hypothetical protein